MGNILQQYRLTRAGRRNDKATLTLPKRRHKIDHTRAFVFQGRIINLHLKPFVGIERSEVVEVNFVTRFFRLFKVDGVDPEKGKITFPIFRASDFTLNRIASPQAETPDLAGADIDIVRARQIVRIWRS